MKAVLCAVLAFVAVAAAVSVVTSDTKTQFESFMTKFGKTYTGDEYNLRLKYFSQNMLRLQRQQADANVTWEVGVTKFFDMSRDEWNQYLGGGRKYSAANMAISCLAKGVTAPAIDRSAAPTSVDWTKHTPAVVEPIKDQGQCGSCWAFSTISVIESAWAIAGNPLTSFSEQEIVDCSTGCSNEPPYGNVCNQGCNGGWPWNAFVDVVSWGGVELESKYVYTAQTGTCKRTANGPATAPISNYTCLSHTQGAPADEDDMAAFLAANGPISIAMDAGILETYTGGIIKPTAGECSQVQLDHAIVIVGYDFTGPTPYWIVRNSWGTSWGEKGYFRIVKGTNACGLATAVSHPIIAK
jgi:C1A family cysteine protease